ncbi:hypothetical protein TDB9533_02405 [Thalassocella blandensis]|nr:hypothetical protein TDB9533_02405 [Thalassocella blandensis]
MNWLDKLGAKKGLVSIEVLADGLAVASKGCFSTPESIDVMGVLTQDAGDLTVALHDFVSKHRLSKRLCHLILNIKDYNLLLVEAPDVPDEELREAVRWRIKDLISIPVEKALVDVFLLPADGNRSGKKMVYVVVAERTRIQTLVDQVHDSGLTLASIDIAEMALRNISLIKQREGDNNRGVAIARIVEGGGTVSLYRNGNMYLSRQFKLNYGGGLLDDLPNDALALEVQRSLDYYERQMGLAPPSVLYLCGENISADKINEEFKRSLTVPVAILSLQGDLPFPEESDESLVQMCIGALGGVHREVAM